MRVTDTIRARKTHVVSSPWTDDKLKTKDFPLSKKRGRAYPLTRRYRWQIITFVVGVREFRVLVAYHTLVPEFIVTLAEEIAGDCRVLARWEFHATHGGWHVHTVCGHTDSITAGIVKPAGTRRIPDIGSYHRHTKMLNHGHAMDDKVASVIACSLVGIVHQSDLLALEAVPWL